MEKYNLLFISTVEKDKTKREKLSKKKTSLTLPTGDKNNKKTYSKKKEYTSILYIHACGMNTM